jgi:hypothetical protein
VACNANEWRSSTAMPSYWRHHSKKGQGRRRDRATATTVGGARRHPCDGHGLFQLPRVAEDKPVVLIKAQGIGPLFDVDNMIRVFEYNPNLWQTTVEKDMPNLRDFIKGAWDNRGSEKSYMKILRGAKAKAG